MYLGVKAVVVKSFARIHKANLINFGIAPLTFRDAADYEAMAKDDLIFFPSFIDDIKKGNEVKAVNKSSGKEMIFLHDLTEKSIDILIEGGMLNYTKKSIT